MALFARSAPAPPAPTAEPAAQAAAASPPGPPGYLELTRDLHLSLVLILPLLAVYGISLALVDFGALNGVDFLTRYVYAYHARKGLVVVNLVALAAFLAAIIRLEHDGRFRPGLFIPLLLESAAWAWMLGLAMTLVVEHLALLGVGVGGPALAAAGILPGGGHEGFRNAMLSIGAGVYEEIVFRLILIAVIDYVGRDLIEIPPRASMAIAVVASSVLFAAAHHVGPFGEPFDLVVFCFRAGAGLAFAAIYRARSLAVAVYAHALYDIRVLVL